MFQSKHFLAIGASLFLGACNLTVENSGGGVVMSDDERINCGEICSADYNNAPAVPVTLEAVPDAGYVFNSWGGACEGLDECVVEVGASSGNKRVVANFSVDPAAVVKRPIDIVDRRTCAIEGNDVVCWYASYEEREVFLEALANPVSVAADWYNVCAIDDTGIVCAEDDGRSWSGLANPVDIANGTYYGCAIDAFAGEESVNCWGSDRQGNGMKITLPFPVNDPKEISIGRLHGCLIDEEQVKCWWRDENTSEIFALDVPAGIVNPEGIDSQDAQSCVLSDNGPVCWSYSSYTYEFELQEIPPAVESPDAIAAGAHHACVIDSNDVKCWGTNISGETTVPEGLLNPRYVEAGYIHTCAIDDLGIVCWGDPDTNF